MNIILAPFMVQARLDSDVDTWPALTHGRDNFEVDYNQKVAEQAKQVALIRLNRPDLNRTIRVTPTEFDTSELEVTRLGSWALTRSILDTTSATQDPMEFTIDFLRDQKQFEENLATETQCLTVGETAVSVQSEEIYLDDANELIDTLKSRASIDKNSEYANCEAHVHCINRHNDAGVASHIPLRGYEFNTRDTQNEERTFFDSYPSCEIFLAVAALRQATTPQVDEVVRICHYGIRNRDTSAKNLLQLAGHTQLPIHTVAHNDQGVPNKIFSWGNSTDNKAAIRLHIRAASAQLK